MIFWILGGLTIVWALGWWRVFDREVGSQPRRAIGWLFLPLAVAWIAWAAILGQANVVAYHQDHRADLLTLRDRVSQDTHGSASGAYLLVVGAASGSIDTAPEWRYTWYERDPHSGAIHLRSEGATDEDITVFEDAPTRPYVLELQEGTRQPEPGWLAPFGGYSINVEGPEQTGWELHVPPGTVERDLQLDAK